MSKQEFLNGLRAALTGRVGAGEVNENVNYYEEYINAQLRQGKREEDVLKELGDPRLIARTIIEAGKHEEGIGNVSREYTAQGEQQEYQSYGSGRKYKVHRMPVWLIVLLSCAVMLGILALVIMFVWWLAPIILVIWLITMAVRLLNGRR